MSFLKVLRSEFEGDEGSFLYKLRVDFVWDRDRFSNLVDAMKKCCEVYAAEQKVDRWMAQGFWFMSIFVREHTLHPNFPKTEEAGYYDRAFDVIEGLAGWFFNGSTSSDRKRFDI